MSSAPSSPLYPPLSTLRTEGSSLISPEDRDFLNQIPQFLANLTTARLDLSNEPSFVASGQSISVLPLVERLRQFIDRYSEPEVIPFIRKTETIFLPTQITFLKEEIPLKARCMVYQLLSRMNILCKDNTIYITDSSSVNLILAQLTTRISRFSGAQFEAMKKRSFFLKDERLFLVDKTSTSYPPIREEFWPQTVREFPSASFSTKIYILTQEVLIHVKEEQDGSSDIREGRWHIAVKASSPTLEAFPPGLLPLIASFLLYWTEN